MISSPSTGSTGNADLGSVGSSTFSSTPSSVPSGAKMTFRYTILLGTARTGLLTTRLITTPRGSFSSSTVGSEDTGISYCGSSTVSVVPSPCTMVLRTIVTLVGSTRSSTVSSTGSGLSSGTPSTGCTTRRTTLLWTFLTDRLRTMRMILSCSFFSSTSGSDSTVNELSSGLTYSGCSTTVSSPVVGSTVRRNTVLLLFVGSSTVTGDSSTLFSMSLSSPVGSNSLLRMTVTLLVTITGRRTTLLTTTPWSSLTSSTVSGSSSSGVISIG